MPRRTIDACSVVIGVLACPELAGQLAEIAVALLIERIGNIQALVEFCARVGIAGGIARSFRAAASSAGLVEKRSVKMPIS
jgi:hypothetical protein